MCAGAGGTKTRIFLIFRISLIFHIFLIFMVSQRSGRHLESFLEPVRFILTKYEPISSHMDPIPLDFSRFF